MNQNKLKKLVKEENALFKKAKILRRYVIVFPTKQKPPFFARFVLRVLQMYKAQIEVEYLEK